MKTEYVVQLPDNYSEDNPALYATVDGTQTEVYPNLNAFRDSVMDAVLFAIEQEMITTGNSYRMRLTMVVEFDEKETKAN